MFISSKKLAELKTAEKKLNALCKELGFTNFTEYDYNESKFYNTDNPDSISSKVQKIRTYEKYVECMYETQQALLSYLGLTVEENKGKVIKKIKSK